MLQPVSHRPARTGFFQIDKGCAPTGAIEEPSLLVTPAKAGAQRPQAVRYLALDPGFRRDDEERVTVVVEERRCPESHGLVG